MALITTGKIPEVDYSQYYDVLDFPHLYESINDDFTTVGTVLPDALTCQVVWNSNQFPTLQMTYPRDGKNALKIEPNKYILEDVNRKFTHQIFKITHVQKEFDNFVVDAEHISATLNDATVPDAIQLVNGSATDLMNQVFNSMQPKKDFTFYSEVDNVQNINIQSGQQAGNLLMDLDQEGDTATQSVLGSYGGELEFNNFDIHHSKHAGKDAGIIIDYGKNLSSANMDKSIENMYTGGVFVATYTPGQAVADEKNVDWNNWSSDYEGVGQVTYMSGGSLPIYDSPVEGHHQVGTLQNGQKIHLGTALADGTLIQNPKEPDNPNNQLQVNTVNGHTWYPISPADGGGWIDGEWLNFDNEGSYLVSNVTGSITVKAADPHDESGAGTRVSMSGYAVVAYAPGKSIHGYNSPEIGEAHYRNKHTYKNGTRVHYDMIERNQKGDLWYRIGNHNWLYGPHLSLSQNGTYQSFSNYGYGEIKNKATKYHLNKDGKMVATTKTIAVNSSSKKAKRYVGKGKNKVAVNNGAYYSMKQKKVKVTAKKGMAVIDKTIVQGGETYHHTKYGWVKSSSISYKADGSIKAKTADQVLKDKVKDNSKVEIYATPDKNDALNWSIPNGETFTIDKGHEAKSGDGKTYVQVTYKGKTGWLPEDNIDSEKSKLNAPEDTADSDSDDASTSSATVDQSQKEVRVVVGPLYADGYGIDPNVDKVNTVDISSYFKHDDQDLSGQQDDGSFVATSADIQQATEIGQNYLKEHRYGKPTVSLTVSYQEMSGINADFTQLSLYDYVYVNFEKLGIQEKAEVNATTWDCLSHHYLSITIGELPQTYEHLLMQATQNNTERVAKNLSNKIQRNTGFITQAKYALSLEGDQRKEMEYSMMKGLGLFNGGKPVITLKKFNSILEKFTKSADDINNWVTGTHDAVLKGLTDDGKVDWMNATMIAAKREDGSGMVLDVGGLEYYDTKGNPRAAIASNGNIMAENVHIAGTLDAINVNAAKITGSLIADVGGFEMTVGAPNKYATSDWDSSKGFAIGSKNYALGLSSGQMFITGKDSNSTWTGNYGPSYIYLEGKNQSGFIRLSASGGWIEINGDRVLTKNTFDGRISSLEQEIADLKVAKQTKDDSKKGK